MRVPLSSCAPLCMLHTFSCSCHTTCPGLPSTVERIGELSLNKSRVRLGGTVAKAMRLCQGSNAQSGIRLMTGSSSRRGHKDVILWFRLHRMRE
ncbi:hypothetical protein BP00DRAFT_217190 [Aspergillus indologenus CBS 114.80]|uniref:Uncharacterized protein n=1 Tax=Aspergillus indologenus CBS 114.80 TaxID=1450541 RepID=A0A2V5IFZ1_9EURO|nr:hypothetical protein BP00DRAFT_217190 [Aspergillus indologenus CBS 114.80]